MSYCRFAWDNSDVYVYPGSDGFWCAHWDAKGMVTKNPDEMAAHLEAHIAAGDHVPEYVMPKIRADAASDRFGWLSGGTT